MKKKRQLFVFGRAKRNIKKGEIINLWFNKESLLQCDELELMEFSEILFNAQRLIYNSWKLSMEKLLRR